MNKNILICLLFSYCFISGCSMSHSVLDIYNADYGLNFGYKNDGVKNEIYSSFTISSTKK